jgi:hypothetical protein
MFKRPAEEVKDRQVATVSVESLTEPSAQLPAPQPYQQEEVPAVSIKGETPFTQQETKEAARPLSIPAEAYGSRHYNPQPWAGETTTIVSKQGDTVAGYGKEILPEWELSHLAGTFCTLNPGLMSGGCNEASFRKLPAGVNWVFPALQEEEVAQEVAEPIVEEPVASALVPDEPKVPLTTTTPRSGFVIHWNAVIAVLLTLILLVLVLIFWCVRQIYRRMPRVVVRAR